MSEKNSRASQPVSPATYGSSMEASPSSSLDLKGRAGKSGYSLKTSTELLKVLNRIWSLEEQHSSHVSLVKVLKADLVHARGRIRELMQEQRTYRHEMDDLMNQVAEDKFIRKSKEQDRIKAMVKSITDELEDERRLRRRSESSQRKLGKELSEVKILFSKALNDLENERKTNSLLEDLCDEFAKGVADYEQEVRELKQKSPIECYRKTDHLVLHISEAWLDERLQLKIAEAQGDMSEKSIIIDRLSREIETFLQARHSTSSMNDILYQKDVNLRRQSLESVLLNGVISAPRDAEDDDSIASDLHCFELNMTGDDNGNRDKLKSQCEDGAKAKMISNIRKKKMGYSGKYKHQCSSNFEAQFEEQIDRTETCNVIKMQLADRIHGIKSHTDVETGGTEGNHVDILMPQTFEKPSAQEGDQDNELKWTMHGPNHLIEKSGKIQSEFYEDCSQRVESHGKFPSRSHFVPIGEENISFDFQTLSSPVQQWSPHHISPDLRTTDCSTRLPKEVNENTLKAKLLEARLEGRHARLKASKGSSTIGI